MNKADLVINIHCNTRPDSIIFQEINIGNPKTKEKMEKMAKAFGVTTMVVNEPLKDDAPPILSNLVAKKGVPNILMELIDGRWISEPSTSVGVKGVLNIMKAFDMIDGQIEPQQGIKIIPGPCKEWGIVRANRGGLIRFLKKPGEFMKKDEVFAEIYDLYGDVIERVKMPVDGYTWAYPCGDILGTNTSLQAVQTGANVAYVLTQEGKSTLANLCATFALLVRYVLFFCSLSKSRISRRVCSISSFEVRSVLGQASWRGRTTSVPTVYGSRNFLSSLRMKSLTSS